MVVVLMMTSISAPSTNNEGDDGDEDDDGTNDYDDLHHRPLYCKASHHPLPRSQGPRCTLATGRSENIQL